jgi:hypothetical protein
LDTTDPERIAQQIKLASSASADLRQARVKRASAFSWSRVGEMYREFLKKIVARG